MKWILALLLSAIILFPILSDKEILRKNDLDGNISSYAVLRQSIFKEHAFPQWNIYVNQGLPIVGDPLNTFFNPLASIPFILLPVEVAIKAVYFFCFFLSIASMYLLLRFMKVNQEISFLLGLTYSSSGYVVSRIIAGHFEKILSYPALPLAVLGLYIISLRKNIQWAVITSLIFTYIFFSGDVYNLLYGMELLLASEVYILFTNKRLWYQPILISLFFIFFSALKLFPFIQLSHLLIKQSNPYAGSQNIISTLYYLFIPVKPIFSIVHLTQFITTDYGWWEKIAFIGPVPFLSLVLACRVKNHRKLVLITFLFILITLLIAMPASLLNPYHYAIVFTQSLQLFHVPSRIFALMSVCMLVLCGLVANAMQNKKIAVLILSVNLFIVASFFQATYAKKNNQIINPSYQNLFLELKKIDQSAFSVAQQASVSPLPHYDAFSKDIAIADASYGVQLKDSPSVSLSQFDYGVKKKYVDLLPKYAVLQNGTSFIKKLPGKIILHNGDVYIYQFKNYTPFAQFEGKEARDIVFKANTIQVSLHEQSAGCLTLLQSSFPGWSVYIDNKKNELQNDRFLVVKTMPGDHIYRFVFSSIPFLWGSIISLVSFMTVVSVLFTKLLRQKAHQVFLDSLL